MKKCTRCEKDKELSEFFKDKYTYDGRGASCKTCVYHRRQNPVVRPKLPKEHKQCNSCKLIKPFKKFWSDKTNKTDGRYSYCIECKNKAIYSWREKNKDYYNASMRTYRATQSPMERRDIDLKSWYGVPHGWYEKTLKAQEGKCAICRKINTSKKRCFAVDHNHKTGEVRGIICYNCNRLLHAFDNLDLYSAIMEYLSKHKSKEVA